MKIRYLFACALFSTILTVPASSQTRADTTAIVATALDYIEGWYEGNAERMERALHPQLAKRIVNQSETGSQLGDMTAEMLVGYVKNGGGKGTPEEQQQKDVTVLDIYQEMAQVKVVAKDWVDYMQIAKWNGEWKIINVLWSMKPR